MSNVFPGVPESELKTASSETFAKWDSVAHVTLLSAVAQEFEIDFEIEEYEELTSYQLILDRLAASSAGA
jgi:acyl carrier protein